MNKQNTSLIKIAAVLMLITISSVSADIIPASRKINWNPGVRGGIPTTFGTDCTASPLPATSSASVIQSALTLCGNEQQTACAGRASCPSRVLKLAAGTFNIASTLTIPSYVVLRGTGMRNDTEGTGTSLKGTSAHSGNTMILFDASFDEGWGAPSRSLVTPTKDATTITTTAAHGWSVGDVVLIDMKEQPAGSLANGVPSIDNGGSLGNCGWCGREAGTRPIGQWSKITAVPSTTTATIDPPLYFSYRNTPEATEMRGLTHYAGVEDLTVDNLASAAQDTVGIFGGINSWLRNVELKGNKRRAVWGYGALWFTMQSCRVVGGIPIDTDRGVNYHSDRAYGPFLGPHYTAGLITDSIFEKLTMGIALEGAASGNVFSYNFITDIWWEDTGDSPRRFGPLMHGPHPFMNLYEGNWSGGRIRHDEYWGTSSHFTYLRNRVIQVDRGSGDSQSWTVDVERRNWYLNFIGNVLGGGPKDGEKENKYEYINGLSAPYGGSTYAIWKIGYESLGSDNTLYDANTLKTMIRWGNWTHIKSDGTTTAIGNLPAEVDPLNDRITWHNYTSTGTGDQVNLSDREIPKSYYGLTSAPSWFTVPDPKPGNPNNVKVYQWPPYDPYNDASHNDCEPRIPAHGRYFKENPTKYPWVSTCPPPVTSGPGPNAPSQLRIGS